MNENPYTPTNAASRSDQGRRGPVGVGLIGAGMISGTYLDNLTQFPDTHVIIVGDLDPDRARGQAGKHAVHQHVSTDGFQIDVSA